MDKGVAPRPGTCANGLFLLADGGAVSTTRDFALSLGRDKLTALIKREATNSANYNPGIFASGCNVYFCVPAQRTKMSPGNFPVRKAYVRPRRRIGRAVTSFLSSGSAVVRCILGRLVNWSSTMGTGWCRGKERRAAQISYLRVCSCVYLLLLGRIRLFIFSPVAFRLCSQRPTAGARDRCSFEWLGLSSSRPALVSHINNQ